MLTRPALPWYHPATWISTWFGSGLLPKAPGTWGSLAALPPGALLVWLGGPWALVGGIAAVLLLGLWATSLYAVGTGRDDPSDVVIDEVAGQWLALLPAGLNPILFVVAFAAFRAADIVKPWPVGWIDRRIKGAFGVMADDLVAAVYAALVTHFFANFLG